MTEEDVPLHRLRTPFAVPALLALAVLLFAGACSRGPERPNIVVIVLDTVRRDHTGLGAEASGITSATPNLDRLAAEGTGFVDCSTNAPWTVPSHASLFSGLLPSSHLCSGKNFTFGTSAPTAAELLRDSGYETVAFYSNPWLTDRLTGMLRGFEEQYDESGSGTQILSWSDQGGTATVANISGWLRERSDRRPFLMFVNFLEPHLPYDPPQDYRSEHLPDIPLDAVVETQWAHRFNAGVVPDDEIDFDRIRRLYAGDVHTVDGHLGSVLTLLRERGLYENTVIVVTSDHGENLGDHGFLDHQFGVFATLVEVPLVIRAPGRLEPGRRDDPAMLTDIFATLLDIAGVEGGPPTPHARSLLGEPAPHDRPVIAQYAGANAPLLNHLRSLNPEFDTSRIENAYSKVRVGEAEFTLGSDGSGELYDLAADPGRERNILNEDRPLANTLFELLPGIDRSPGGNPEIDEEMRERLRALGYIR